MAQLEAPAAEGARGDRRTAVGVSLTLGGRVVSFTSQFVSQILMGRMVGRGGYGLVQLALSVVVLTASLSRLGTQRLLLKFLPAYRGAGRAGAASGLLRWATVRLAVSTLLATVLVLAAGWWVAGRVFGRADLAGALPVVAFALPLINAALLASAVGLATGRVREDVVGQRLVQPLALLLGLSVLALLARVDKAPWQILAVYVASWGVACAVIAPRFVRGLRKTIEAPPERETKAWGGYALTSTLFDVAFRFRDWLDILVVGFFLATETVGPYAAAVKLAFLPTVLLTSFSEVIAWRLSLLYSKGDRPELRRIYAKVTYTVLLLALPAFVALALLGEDLLGLFGPGFAAAHVPLVILASGALINASTGPTSYLLLLTDNERWLGSAVVGGLATSVLGAILLIPLLGTLGAALASLSGVLVLNGVQLLRVRHVLGGSPYDATFLRLAAPLGAALLVVVGLREAMPSSFLRLALASALGALAYGAVAFATRAHAHSLLHDLLRPRPRPKE